ncbi:collectin-10-like [Limulus polyphemus]|uniref:Collectin-10-like n=1 Tax=Limulus polyphemus TaxID=6850 RepID=A0ABM1SEU9_LIMPO|nr:collectin-10-like [Limulus polyphemus]
MPFTAGIYNQFTCTCLLGFKGTFCEVPPAGYKYHDGSFFKFYATLKYNSGAVTSCEMNGGRLAMIKDQATVDFLKNTIFASVTNVYVWIGVRKISNVWQYAPTGFSNWHPPMEPSGDGPCVEMREVWNYEWNDLPCNYNKNFLCEIVIP